jgi:sarcosine oxidase subunit alpha
MQRLHEKAVDRHELIGLVADDPSFPLNEGAQLIERARDTGFGTIIGHVTSAAFSPTLDRHVALALLRNGRNRVGDAVLVIDPMRGITTAQPARVAAPVFYDPENARVRG